MFLSETCNKDWGLTKEKEPLNSEFICKHFQMQIILFSPRDTAKIKG